MHKRLECLLVAILSVSLVEAPGFGAASSGLGVVLEADHAWVGLGAAASGATVFDGDTLATDANGTMRVRLSGAQLYLLANSTADMRRAATGASAELQRGTVIFSAASAEALELHASDARIRPKSSQLTYAQITLVSPQEFVVTCQRGQLEVAVDDEVRTIPEATSYRVIIDPQDDKTQGEGQPPHKAGRTRFLLIALILIGAGTGVGVWRALISPDRP